MVRLDTISPNLPNDMNNCSPCKAIIDEILHKVRRVVIKVKLYWTLNLASYIMLIVITNLF